MSQSVGSLENFSKEGQASQLETFFEPQTSLNTLFQEVQIPTLKDGQGSLQGRISEIGKTDPDKAQAISQILLNYQGTQDQKDLLRKFGIVVSNNFYRSGLVGGMEAAFVGSVVPFIIKFLVKGVNRNNKEEMDKEVEKKIIRATIQLPNGEIEGDHEGKRVVVQTEKSKGRFKRKQYEFQATGYGIFVSDEIKYKGTFYKNYFHTNPDDDEATLYYMKYNMYYVGRFNMGKKSGRGNVYRISIQEEEKEEKKEEKKDIPCFLGSWRDNRPEKGFYYNELGEIIVAIKDGFVQTNKNMTSFFSTLPEFLRPPANPYNFKAFPIEMHPLIAQKLENPDKELTLDESLELITTCLKYGNEHSEKINGRKAIIVMGNTGSGKSTMINYLSGCTMELKDPTDLGFKGAEDVVVVKSKKEGGIFDEIMPIGHDLKKSRTFMPQIETDPQEQFTYCDCPGFLDNRGAEINISNAVNIRNIVMQAKSVKIIILINYHTLLGDKGRGISDMLKICFDFFGNAENLEQYKSSLLLGVTHVPETISLEKLKGLIVDENCSITKLFAERLFLFDYLNRDIKDRLNRDDILLRLEHMPSIENPSQIFKIALTDSDEMKLIDISEHMGKKIQEALEVKNFSLAARHLKSLQNLSIIDHISIERILHNAIERIRWYFQEIVDDFKTCCMFNQLDEAANLLKELEEGLKYFNAELNNVERKIDLSILSSEYKEVHARQTKYEEETNQMKELINNARKNAQEFAKLLEEQKQGSREQFQAQQERFEKIFQGIEDKIKKIKDFYESEQQRLKKEMQIMIEKKGKELKEAQAQALKKEINQRIESMQKEYEERIGNLEREKDERLRDLEDQKQNLEDQKREAKLEQQKKEKEYQDIIRKLKEEKEQANLVIQKLESKKGLCSFL